MSGQQKNSKTQERLATTDSGFDLPSLIIGKMVRYVVIPCLLFYGNHLLDNITTELKQLSKAQAEMSTKIDVQRVNSEAYKAVIEKHLELVEYRLSILEESYGKIHTKLFGEWSARPNANAHSLGKSANVEQFNFNSEDRGARK